MEKHPTTNQVIEVFDTIMSLAQIERHNTVPFDTRRHENVAEHTYGLAALACSLAASVNNAAPNTPLDIGEIAQMGLVHDLTETFMRHGDISVYADASLLNAKADDEAKARRLLAHRTKAFPWIAATVQKYESQETPESRFVYALDKLVVHIVVLLSDHHHVKPTYQRYLETEDIARRKITTAFPALLPYFEDLCTLVKTRPHFFSDQATPQ